MLQITSWCSFHPPSQPTINNFMIHLKPTHGSVWAPPFATAVLLLVLAKATWETWGSPALVKKGELSWGNFLTGTVTWKLHTGPNGESHRKATWKTQSASAGEASQQRPFPAPYTLIFRNVRDNNCTSTLSKWAFSDRGWRGPEHDCHGTKGGSLWGHGWHRCMNIIYVAAEFKSGTRYVKVNWIKNK